MEFGWIFGEVYRAMDEAQGIDEWVVEVEVYRGTGISERQNYFESPVEKKPELERRAGLHQELNSFLTDISRAVFVLPNSGILGTKRIQGRLYGG